MNYCLDIIIIYINNIKNHANKHHGIKEDEDGQLQKQRIQ